MPVGPASAPATDISAAPGYAGDPVATPTTPRVYLSDVDSGRGHQRVRSESSGSQTAGGASSHGRPMSTTSTSPASAAAGPTTRAGFRQPKATVTSALTAGPSTAPV